MMTKISIGATDIEVTQGDITQQKGIDAIVNAANAWLKPGGGVAGAIHRAAGPELERECRQYAPIKPGQAVLTQGYHLPNPYVIHVLGPVYGKDKPEAELLAACYRNALLLAEGKNLQSIAFPAVSTGAFGYPLHEAAKVSMQAVRSTLEVLKHLKHIRFVLFDTLAKEAFQHALKDVLQ